jgi:hypothetical protein
MTLHTLFTDVATSPDFSNVNASRVSHIPVWVMILVAAIIIIIAITVGIRCGDGSIAILIICFGVALSIPAFLMIDGLTATKTPGKDNSKELKEWVQEEYLIDITQDQARDLIDYQIDLSANGIASKSSSLLVKDAYGNLVEIKLVKDGDNWLLFQSGNNAVDSKQ